MKKLRKGCVYFDFNTLKRLNMVPDDALFKFCKVDNDTEEIAFYFYTDQDIPYTTTNYDAQTSKTRISEARINL